MEYKPGTLRDYQSSMGEQIRIVFEKLWKEKYETDLPSETQNERRLLFVSIAQGIIQHLVTNSLDSFDIEVNIEQQTNTGPWISSEGNLLTFPIQVTQINDPNNKVKSTGKGKENIKVNIKSGELIP